jgi:heme-degrading monooxygenase HmoA
MIARTWQGATRAADAETYAGYVRQTGIPGYVATPGNRGAWLLCRIDGERAEFLTMSLWDSLEAIRAFGEDAERAVYYRRTTTGS